MTNRKEPTILIIFGGMGDLTWRKLAPARNNLLLAHQLPERFAVIELDGKQDLGLDEFRQRLKDGANRFCECGHVEDENWESIAPQEK